MPIYDYVCACGARFECWKKLTDRKFANCPECSRLAPLVASVANFHLDPVSGDFPTRTEKWAKSHEKANMDDLKSLGLRESKFSGVI